MERRSGEQVVVMDEHENNNNGNFLLIEITSGYVKDNVRVHLSCVLNIHDTFGAFIFLGALKDLLCKKMSLYVETRIEVTQY